MDDRGADDAPSQTTADPTEASLPTAWLDVPEDGDVLDGSVHVRGWAVPEAGRFSVEAWLGERRLGFVDVIRRPDVAIRHGMPTTAQCGFETTFALDVHEGGPRRLRVVVTSSDGTRYALARDVQVAGAVTEGGSRDEPAQGYRVLRASADAPGRGDGTLWFAEHYRQAAGEIVEFLAGSDLSIEDRTVADVGCGDGIIDLGLMHLAGPRRLVGFDLEPVSTDRLLEEARANGVAIEALPAGLEFRACSPTDLPARDARFDAVVSWSTFEHVRHPVRLLREIRRVLRPDGFLFLQIWPLWCSQHGSHLWPWYPQGFAPLLNTDDEVLAGVADDPRGSPDDMAFIAHEYRHLNRISVDDLQRSLLAAGLIVAKFELLASAVHVPSELSRYPLSELGVDGIKLLAVPA